MHSNGKIPKHVAEKSAIDASRRTSTKIAQFLLIGAFMLVFVFVLVILDSTY